VKFLKVAEAMRKSVVTVDEGISVTEASMIMRNKGEGCAIILRQGKPFGIVTERDVTWKVAGEGLDPKNVKVFEVMSTPLITINPDADLQEAAKVMKEYKIRRLAVVQESILYGVLTAADVSRNLERYLDDERRNILRYLWMPQYYSREG
jgi:CBS domain-containing protein